MMPWGLFSLALVLVLVLQTSVLPFCAPPAVDLLLALALVCGLTAPAVDARLAACLEGPGAGVPAGCECVDVVPDGQLDLADFAAFQTLYTS